MTIAQMEPTTEHERDIASRVDAKASAIRDGLGRWDYVILTEMRLAVPFELSESEMDFLARYITWRRNNLPRSGSI